METRFLLIGWVLILFSFSNGFGQTGKCGTLGGKTITIEFTPDGYCVSED